MKKYSEDSRKWWAERAEASLVTRRTAFREGGESNMLKRLMERRKEEGGFTLIELMVVVVIIAIVIAIALPTFLRARNGANDKAAESSLRNGLASAKTCFTDRDAYIWTVPSASSCDAATLAQIEQSLTFGPTATVTASLDPNTVMVNPINANTFTEAAFSKAGT